MYDCKWFKVSYQLKPTDMFRYHISTKRCFHRLVVIEYSSMRIMKPKQTFHWIIYKTTHFTPRNSSSDNLLLAFSWASLQKKLSYNINKLNFFILSYKNLFVENRLYVFFFYHNSLLKFLKNVSALKATLPVSCLKKIFLL